jgi:TrmH family RNA methyltransferase
LYDFLRQIREEKTSTPLYGTFLEGNNIYKESLTTHGIIIMGNEGNGIGAQVQSMVTHKLLIPNYPEGCATSESLNVAIATAITCAEFRRR